MPDQQPGIEYDDSGEPGADQDANASFDPIPVGGTLERCPFRGAEHQVICEIICSCKFAPKPQFCVSTKLWALDASFGFTSTIKAEVPYDMTNVPPTPYMSKSNPMRSTRRRPSGSRIPDAVIVKDGSKAPTQDNIAEVIEIKFPPDDWSEGQQRAYEKIAGDAPVTELGPNQCGCPETEEPFAVPAPVPVPKEQKETAGLTDEQVELALGGLAIVAGLLLAPEITVPCAGGGILEVIRRRTGELKTW